jgi:hypothetical protein
MGSSSDPLACGLTFGFESGGGIVGRPSGGGNGAGAIVEGTARGDATTSAGASAGCVAVWKDSRSGSEQLAASAQASNNAPPVAITPCLRDMDASRP